VKLTTLPESGEIIRRLTSVSAEPWNVQRLYPKIAAAGGTQRAGIDLPLLFERAIADVSGGGTPQTLLRHLVPRWLRALVDDPEVLADALAALEEINADLGPGA